MEPEQPEQPNSPTWACQETPETGRIYAVQHGCGVMGLGVNAKLDTDNNWYCPKCGEVFAAADQSGFRFIMQKCVIPSTSPTPQEWTPEDRAAVQKSIDELNAARNGANMLSVVSTFATEDKTPNDDNAAPPA